MMYWHIGERINRVVLGDERATYGKQIVPQVATQLQAWYGSKGFEQRTIRRMVQFAQEFPDWQIVSPLVSKLSWTHFLTIITLHRVMYSFNRYKSPLKLQKLNGGMKERRKRYE